MDMKYKNYLFAWILSVWGISSLDMQAENIETWIMVTDKNVELPIGCIDYMISADGVTQFSVVMKDGQIYEDINSVSFRKGTVSGWEETSVRLSGIAVYPTLVRDYLTVSGIEEGKTFYIYSLSGTKIGTYIVKSNRTHISMSGLSAGTYLIRTGHSTVKFIKK